MHGALALNAIEFNIKSTNFGAETILFGDTRLKAVDIERNDVETRRGECGSERTKKSEALFEQFQITCGVSAHGLGPFIQLVLLVFLEVRVRI